VLLTLVLASGVLHTLRLLLAGVIVGVVLGAARDLVTLAVPTSAGDAGLHARAAPASSAGAPAA
jgi:hypothetical protein